DGAEAAAGRAAGLVRRGQEVTRLEGRRLAPAAGAGEDGAGGGQPPALAGAAALAAPLAEPGEQDGELEGELARDADGGAPAARPRRRDEDRWAEALDGADRRLRSLLDRLAL